MLQQLFSVEYFKIVYSRVLRLEVFSEVFRKCSLQDMWELTFKTFVLFKNNEIYDKLQHTYIQFY